MVYDTDYQICDTSPMRFPVYCPKKIQKIRIENRLIYTIILIGSYL